MTSSSANIQPQPDQFAAEPHIRIRVRLLAWATAWSDRVKVALYSDGPDVSEVSSTWLGDRVVNQNEIWAIPWFTGVRLLFYRRNLLQAAGLDENVAFQTAEPLEQALRLLQASGVRIPWTVPTGLTQTTLLNSASWVWGANGDFC